MPEHCPNHAEHEVRIKRLELDIQELDSARENHTEIIGKINERLGIVDQSSRSAHHRLNAQEQQTQAIAEMAASVKLISEQIKDVVTTIKTHDSRIVSLERTPSKEILETVKSIDARVSLLEQMPAKDALARQKLVATVVITSITSGAVGFVLSNLAR